MIALELALPPSFNGGWIPIYRKGKPSMIKDPNYTKWIGLAQSQILLQRQSRLEGKYTLELYLPESMRGDADNRIKAINDILQRSGLVENDKFNKRIFVDYEETVKEFECVVFVSSYEKQENNVMQRLNNHKA